MVVALSEGSEKKLSLQTGRWRILIFQAVTYGRSEEKQSESRMNAYYSA